MPSAKRARLDIEPVGARARDEPTAEERELEAQLFGAVQVPVPSRKSSKRKGKAVEEPSFAELDDDQVRRSQIAARTRLKVSRSSSSWTRRLNQRTMRRTARRMDRRCR